MFRPNEAGSQEPTLSAVIVNGEAIEAAAGVSLFDTAELAGIRIPTSCRSLGKCKECIVEITAGADALSPPTWHERHLKPPFRLSCQARVASVAQHVVTDVAQDFSPVLECRAEAPRHTLTPTAQDVVDECGAGL